MFIFCIIHKLSLQSEELHFINYQFNKRMIFQNYISNQSGGYKKFKSPNSFPKVLFLYINPCRPCTPKFCFYNSPKPKHFCLYDSIFKFLTDTFAQTRSHIQTDLLSFNDCLIFPIFYLYLFFYILKKDF